MWLAYRVSPALPIQRILDSGLIMSSRRVARLAEAIRETVSSAVLFSLRDPRIKNVTVKNFLRQLRLLLLLLLQLNKTLNQNPSSPISSPPL